MKYTKEQIHAFLKEHGTKYHEKATKEQLYPEYLIALMEESNLITRQILQKAKQRSKQSKKNASRKAARNARRASKKASKKKISP
jgi:hypothetical protein